MSLTTGIWLGWITVFPTKLLSRSWASSRRRPVSQPSPAKYSHTGPESTYCVAKVVTMSMSRWATGRKS